MALPHCVALLNAYCRIACVTGAVTYSKLIKII